MSEIEFYSDRAPIEHVDQGVLAVLQEQGLGKTREKQRVHFCGLVLTQDGKACVFLPQSMQDKNELSARLTIKTRQSSVPKPLIVSNWILQWSNTGYLATIANITEDFKSNGLYLERIKRQTRNRGKIDWRRTIAVRTASYLIKVQSIQTL